MIESIDTMRFLFSSDIFTFITVCLGAYLYIMKYRPAMQSKQKLEEELQQKILAIPTAEDIAKVIQDGRDEVAELAILDSHRQEIIKQVEKYVSEMKEKIFEMLKAQETKQGECIVSLKDNFNNVSSNMDKVMQFIIMVKDYITRSEQRIDSIEKKLVKISTGLRVTYGMLDALVTKLEEGGTIEKINREFIESFKDSITISQNELSSLMDLVGQALKNNKASKSSRFDRFMNEDN